MFKQIGTRLKSIFTFVGLWGAGITTVATGSPGVYTWFTNSTVLGKSLMWPPIPTVGLMLVVFLICLAVLLIFRIINLEKQLDLNIEVNGPFVWTEPKDAIKKMKKHLEHIG